MNKTKRLFALVMSVIMLMTLLPGYGFASDANLANAQTSSIDISGTGVGAAPSTDMEELDVMADDVLIVDSGLSVNDETYSLVWNNSQKNGIPVADKVFKTMTAVQAYAKQKGIASLKVIIAKLDPTTESIDITMPLEIYAQAYNTMPFVVGASPLDPWTYNTDATAKFDDYADLTYALPKVNIADGVTGKVGIYGFTLKEGVDNSANTMPLDIELVNTVIDGASTVLNVENAAVKELNTSSLTVKNMYVKSVAQNAILMKGYVPANVTIDGLYVDAAQAGLKANAINQCGGKTKFVVKNSYFAGCGLIFSFAGDLLNDMKRSNIKEIEITSNIINGVLAGADKNQILLFTPSRYTSLVLNKNYIASGASDTAPAIVGTTADANGYDELPIDVEIRDNIFNGVATDFEVKATASALRTCKLDVANNYLNPAYSEVLDKVEGVELTMKAHGETCKSFYTDYKMKNKSSSAVAILGASATNGDIFVNNSSNTMYYIMKSGDATAVTFTFGNAGTTYKWYSDSACKNEVAATDISMTSDLSAYYMRSFYENKEGAYSSAPYTVTIVRESPTIPYFTEAYKGKDPLISENALFCDINCGWVADGSLYTVEWQGQQYTFIKGVNLFENIDAAVSFASSGGMVNPEFVIKDFNGSHTLTTKWFPAYPGSYFTENYNKKAYIGDPTMAAEDWVSNVGTGEGQYNVAKGITTAGISITGNEPEGDYKLYGFTMTAGISDGRSSNRSNCVNIHLENCFINLTTWGWALFTAADAAPSTTTPTDDYLYIKDTYLLGNGSAHRLFSGWQASHVTFDGLFLNAGAYSTAADYAKQNGANASFRIINSHIKDYSTDLQNQGSNKEIAAGENKTFEISNTIFNNGRISKAAAVTAYTKAWNKIIIKDNTVINDNLTKFTLFQQQQQAAVSGNPCEFIVTGNKCYNVQGTFDFGSRALASTSVVENNYVTAGLYQGGDTVTYGGIKLSALSGSSTVKTGDYWVDSEMTIRPNILMEDYGFVGANVVFDKAAKTVKYIPLAENEIGFVETEEAGKYTYTINLAHIVDNKYGNKMTVSYGTPVIKADINDTLTIKSNTKLETVALNIAVSSPDGTAEAVNYAVTITPDGPVINGVKIDGNDIPFENGKYTAELSGRGMDEVISVDTVEGATVAVTKNGTPVTAIDILNGETSTYVISVTLDGETVSAELVATRRGAEFEEFDAVLERTGGIDPNEWIKGFNDVYQSLLKKMKRIDRASASQAEVDAMAERMSAIMEEAVFDDDYKAFIKTAKRIKNADGKYCTGLYKALTDAIAAADAGVLTVSTAAQYNALTDAVETAMDNLSGHKFVNYVHDKDTETCSGNGTQTATCETAGCDVKDTKPEDEKYATGVHTFKDYVYNGDATHLADGTKTAACSGCGKVYDTVTAEGTKLTLINSSAVFKDVPADKWFKKFVDYVATYKFMEGTAADTFDPNKTITRAEFVKVLANFAGVDTSDNSVSTQFTDLKEGAWYVGAVKWAADTGITKGTSDTTFSPNAQITREQMCVMLVAFAEYAKITPEAIVEKTVFEDDADISSWAKEAVYACQMAGIIEGKGNGFDPKGSATRAEVSVIISIAHENYILA